MTGSRLIGLVLCLTLGCMLATASEGWAQSDPVCGIKGKMFNPLADVDWSSLFPIKLGETSITPGMGYGDYEASGLAQLPLCCCYVPNPTVALSRLGLRVKFWEPLGLIEVTRAPFCSPSFGGMSLGTSGNLGHGISARGKAFFNTHYIKYPIFGMLQLFTDLVCLDISSFDVGWLSEVDPAWADDELALVIHNPEAILFANPVAITACGLDCGFQNLSWVAPTNPYDLLFWCAGCVGGAYPLTGHTTTRRSIAADSQLIASRLIFLLNRVALLMQNIGSETWCPHYLPTGQWRKSHYRLQPALPYLRPSTAIGTNNPITEVGRTIPAVGEDYVFVLWQKRDCCLILPAVCVGGQ